MILGKRQPGSFKKSWPADTLNPVIDSFPVFGVFLIGTNYLLHNRSGFRPSRWIVGDTSGDQLLEARLATRVGVITANPDREFGMFGIVNLHWRAGWVTGTTANTFLFVDFE